MCCVVWVCFFAAMCMCCSLVKLLGFWREHLGAFGIIGRYWMTVGPSRISKSMLLQKICKSHAILCEYVRWATAPERMINLHISVFLPFSKHRLGLSWISDLITFLKPILTSRTSRFVQVSSNSPAWFLWWHTFPKKKNHRYVLLGLQIISNLELKRDMKPKTVPLELPYKEVLKSSSHLNRVGKNWREFRLKPQNISLNPPRPPPRTSYFLDPSSNWFTYPSRVGFNLV